MRQLVGTLGPGRGRLLSTVVILTAVLLFITACGGDDDGSDNGEDDTEPSPPATEVTDDTSQLPTATENSNEGSEPTEASEPSDQSESDDGDYSVLLVTGVDSITAEGQLKTLAEGGFDGFVLEGSAKSGHDVYRSGLSRQEAEDLAEEINEAVFGGAVDPGLWVWETHSWRSEDFVDETGEVDAEAGSSNSSATITVGDTAYEFVDVLPGQCTDMGTFMFGTFATDASGSALQGGDGNRAIAVNFSIPGTDWEAQELQPPQLSIDDAITGERWQAGGVESTTIAQGDSEVVSWELGDGHAEGTATFIDLNAHFAGQETAPISGSFDITCGE